MAYVCFTQDEKPEYPIVILAASLRRDDMIKAYIEPFPEMSPDDVVGMSLFYAVGKKNTSVAERKEWIETQLVPDLENIKAQYIVITDGEYFKQLTGCKKVDAYLGYVLPCVFGPWFIVYAPNYRTIYNDPERVQTRIATSMVGLISHITGEYEEPGNEIIRSYHYPKTLDEIGMALQTLLDLPEGSELGCDIEGFNLRFDRAGIGTISFAVNQHEGIAFSVDYKEREFLPWEDKVAPFGENVRNEPVRELLRQFFELCQHKIIYHFISYDVTVLIYQLFMKDILDTEGLLHGLEVMLKNWDDTKLIAYLATNSCAGNKLGLKDLAQEFAGNYAMGEDIKDITRIPLPKLLQYNLVDSCSTIYVRNKYKPLMVQDEQEALYEGLFKSSIVDIIQMQLTGLPINMERVKEVKKIFEADRDAAVTTIMNSAIVAEFTTVALHESWATAKNLVLKKKRVTAADCKLEFNPASGPQLIKLLYEFLRFPVIATTKTGEPATGAAVLTDLLNHTEEPEVLDLLHGLIAYKTVVKLLESFIPAMEDSILGPDGWHYLCGSFHLGGTLSARLNSSGPNLQNLPAGASDDKKGYYGKLIKSCIQAALGWIYCGVDFNALEDKISAVTTKDPNKIKVYSDGYDGHSLRALAYYPEEMPDIDPNSVESVNSIAKRYKAQRARSKNPTFTLTYQGTWSTLVNKYKFTEELAKKVEERYHALYAVSDKWVADRLDAASHNGYVTAAFGLRVRTPKLVQVVRGNSKTPRDAEAEGRSAGNALGQSWCLLNSRAANEFMGKVRASNYRLDIRPCAQIHDAQYYIVRDDLAAVAFTNEHLVKAVQWQDHPDIADDDVKMSGELSIFHPSWATEIVIPNGADEALIAQTLNDHLSKDKAHG